MKIKCQECGTIIEIEESDYPVGIEQKVDCPLCQNEISFTINAESNPTTTIPPSPKSRKKVKSRLVKKEKNYQSEELLNDVAETDDNTNDTDWEETNDSLNLSNQQLPDNTGTFYRFVYYLGYYSNYIKKGLIICGILLVVYLIYKFAWHSQFQPATIVDSDSIIEVVDSMAVEEVINESDSVISFLTSMYENSKYENYPFLNSHCTQHLLKVLSDAYDYDCNDSPCYATWLFRTSAQDSKSATECENGVISVKDIGDNWFEIEFYDGGWKGIKRIKAYFKENDIMMDMIETIYDEVSENLENTKDTENSEHVSLDNGSFPISILYERKLNESDIADLQPKDLDLLRNVIFARHGYRFTREDLMSYFNHFSWYNPSNDDSSEIYENMTEIEKYNVDFIKSHE